MRMSDEADTDSENSSRSFFERLISDSEKNKRRLDNLLAYLRSLPQSSERRDAVASLPPEDLKLLSIFTMHTQKEILDESGYGAAHDALGQIQEILNGFDGVSALALTPTAYRVNELFLENKRLRALNAELERQKAESKGPISRLQGILAYLSAPTEKPHTGTFLISAEDSALLATFVEHIRKEALAESGTTGSFIAIRRQVLAILEDRESALVEPLALVAIRVRDLRERSKYLQKENEELLRQRDEKEKRLAKVRLELQAARQEAPSLSDYIEMSGRIGAFAAENKRLREENERLHSENTRLQPRCSDIDGDCVGCE